MKALKVILVVLFALVALLIIIGFFLPKQAHVERKQVVHSPVASVFALANDLHTWSTWDPWSRMDPNMKVTFEGPATGTGSIRKWESAKVGNGSMSITESLLNEKVGYKLDFGKNGQANSGIAFKSTTDGTEVTWYMDVDAGGNPVKRYFVLMMDGMIGKDFEKGLASLDSLAKTIPPAAPPVAPTASATDSTATKAAN